jgi:hypothetical protein
MNRGRNETERQWKWQRLGGAVACLLVWLGASTAQVEVPAQPRGEGLGERLAPRINTGPDQSAMPRVTPVTETKVDSFGLTTVWTMFLVIVAIGVLLAVLVHFIIRARATTNPARLAAGDYWIQKQLRNPESAPPPSSEPD